MEENNYLESQENQESQNIEEAKTLLFNLSIEQVLLETCKWTKFLAIMGFVFTGLMVVLGLFFAAFGSAMLSATTLGAIGGAGLGFVYIILGLIYYFPAKYLYDFSVYTKQAIQLKDQESIDYAFERLKSVFKFWGILMIVLIAFYVLAIFFGIASAIFMSL